MIAYICYWSHTKPFALIAVPTGAVLYEGNSFHNASRWARRHSVTITNDMRDVSRVS